MMVGMIGGGMAHVRLADGSHRIIDGQSAVPLACKPECYRPVPGARGRRLRYHRRRKPGRTEGGGDTGFAEGLVRDAAAVRYHAARRRDAARDQPRLARLHGDALPQRLHRQRRTRPVEGRRLVPTRLLPGGKPLPAGGASGSARLCRHARADRERRRGRALRRRARPAPGRVHGSARRLHRRGRSRRHPDHRARSRSAAAIAAGTSSARRRRRPPASTSRRC